MRGKNNVSRLISYMARFKAQIILMSFCAIVGTAFTVVAPKVLGNATTIVFEGVNAVLNGTGTLNFTGLTKLLLAALILYLISALFTFLQGWVLTGISNKVIIDLRRRIADKIDRLPMSYLEGESKGDIQSRITNDVEYLQMGITSGLLQIVTAAVTMAGVVAVMLTINVWLTILSVLVLPMSMLLIRFITKRSQRYFQGQMVHLGKINGQVEENFSGQSILRAYSQEQDALGEFQKENEQLYEAGRKAQFYSSLTAPVTSFAGNLGYVGIAVLGGILVIQKSIAVGDIQAFFQYIKSFTQPMQQIAQVMTMLQSAVAASERIFDFLEVKEEAEEILTPKSISDKNAGIVFQHVAFGYEPGKTIIHDFSVDVKKGQKIAIVGPTGAGKTTIVKLLMRFYDVQKGEIKIGGVNICDCRRDELRSVIGMVLQDVWLFGGTIMENIHYGRPDAADEEVIQAAKEAHAHKFIIQQPDGYDTILDEDADNLSQGQRQLITIARAILADRKILILDEATSSVDNRTEILIQKAMDRLMKGRTSFVIAHRLSTIRDADCILVMKDGEVIEQGSHEELIEKGNFYAELYKSQFEEVA